MNDTSEISKGQQLIKDNAKSISLLKGQKEPIKIISHDGRHLKNKPIN